MHTHHKKSTTTRLNMGKGLNKLKNKQADLKRKMELAKQQQAGNDNNANNDAAADATTEQSRPLSDKEIKERNDRKRFERLLKREGAASLKYYDSDGYLNRNQEEEEISAARAGVDRIYEGDPAPTDCFENLVSITTEKIIAKKGSGRLAPWISKDYNVDIDDYRVIVCDPRKQSSELHQAMKDLVVQSSLPKEIKDRLYFISADTPAETRRWLKKNDLSGSSSSVEIYCDNEELDWVRAYTALGEKRWSMTMFVISKGCVMKLARELDIYNLPQTVMNAVTALKKDRTL